MKLFSTIGFAAMTAMTAMACAANEAPEGEGAQEEPSSLANVRDAEKTGTTKQAIFGSDACKNTEIVITNSRDRNGDETQILVDYVEYYSLSEGRWYSQGLGDTLFDFGDERWFMDVDLQNAENDTITKWRVHYKYKASSAGANWSQPVQQEINTPDEVCHAGDNFYLTVQ